MFFCEESERFSGKNIKSNTLEVVKVWLRFMKSSIQDAWRYRR